MKLDFRTKLLMTLVISTVCISGILEHKYPNIAYGVSFLPFLLLVLERRFRTVIKGALWILVAILITIFVVDKYGGFFGTFTFFIAQFVLKIIPGYMMGYYTLITSSMGEIIASLKQMKLPDVVVIPISVMFRFAYSTIEDYHIVNDAMRMHGLTIRHVLKEPMRIMEYKLVPLLMIVTKTADDVAISAMTRGMRVGAFRTSIAQIKLKIQDYIFILLMIGVVYFFGSAVYA